MLTKLTDVKLGAIQTARAWLDRKPYYLDTETTGLRGDAEIVDLALIDHDGKTLIDTLIRPTSPMPAEATKIHGITNEMVADAPGFSEIVLDLIVLTKDKLVVIYNASFDQRMLHQSAQANKIEQISVKLDVVCAMKLYAQFYGDWNDYRRNYKWQKQANAARQLGIKAPDDLHRAAVDAELCRLIVKGMAATPTGCYICGEETTIPRRNWLHNQLCDRCHEWCVGSHRGSL